MSKTLQATSEPFRSAEEGLRTRRAELLLLRRHELSQLGHVPSTILARRWARALGGLIAVIGFALLPIEALAFGIRGGWSYDQNSSNGLLTLTLLATAVAAVSTWLVARVALRPRADRSLARAVEASAQGELMAEVERLERSSAKALLRDAIAKRERSSTALPLAGACLLLPLLLHWAVSASFVSSTRDFDQWIALSLLIVGHCHVLLALLAWRFAARAQRTELVRGASAGWWAWLWSWLASLVPGLFLIFIPTGLVLFTGLAFVPLTFHLAGRRLLAERAALS